jgi:hypothetical protein
MHIGIATLIIRHVKVAAAPVTNIVREVVFELGGKRGLVDTTKHHARAGRLWFGFEAVHGVMA